MHYRSLELYKTQTLSGSLDYDKTLSLSSQARSDLQWVIENITQCNGRLFSFRKLTFTSGVMVVAEIVEREPSFDDLSWYGYDPSAPPFSTSTVN